MVKAGDVVTVEFPGATGLKRRPAIVISTDLYHSVRPDVVLGLLTTQVSSAKDPTDYLLQDWTAAGLHAASAFRSFFATLPSASISIIGHLSDRDWKEIQIRLRLSVAV
jgi:mRNA interferase MazF